MIDTYRHINPEKEEYSFWTYLFNSRKKIKDGELIIF